MEPPSSNQLSNQELLNRVYYLDMKNRQMQGRIAQLEPYKQRELKNPPKHKHEALFQNFRQEKYALKIMYVGTNYNGVEFQEMSQNTVEGFLFRCLYGLSLVEEPYPGKEYSRAARTDKGVSAYGNVIALNLRTSVPKQPNQAESCESKGSLPYVKMLNSILPEDIRVLSAQRVDPTFNARYQCHSRSYKYFFTRNYYDIEAMRRAISKFQGKHNFINFCKMDVTSTIDFQKNMTRTSIEKVGSTLFELEKDPRNEVYYFHFVANSFLWHQIRYMVSVLFLVGLGSENETVIDDMLDIQKTPSKPNYPAASEFPLLLEDCEFQDLTFEMEQQSSVAIYNTLNSMIMTKVLDMTLYVNCVNVMKGWAFKTLSLTEDDLVAHAQETNRRREMGKSKKLHLRKCTGINYKEKVDLLKGKSKELHDKRVQKRRNYQQKVGSLTPIDGPAGIDNGSKWDNPTEAVGDIK